LLANDGCKLWTMARVYSKDDAGPAAFDVKLGISTGRHSPECDPTAIMVRNVLTDLLS